MALMKSLSFSLGRKRVLISNNSFNLEHFYCSDFESFSPIKRLCSFDYDAFFDDIKEPSSNLEALPQELLIKVICGVNHDDLKQLFVVSKTVRDAAIIAKKLHFEYSTPSKIKAFRNSIDLLNNDYEEIEAPNAPKQARKSNRTRICKKKLDDISIALFANGEDDVEEEDERWPRRSLFMDIDS